MAHRLSRGFLASATIVLLLAGQRLEGQPVRTNSPNVGAAPRAAQSTASAKELPAPAADELMLPTLHHTRSRTFALPVVMDQTDRLGTSEIRLFSRKTGSEWVLEQKGDGNVMRFDCKVEADGEYWYVLALVDKTGRMTPGDLTKETPQQRIMVDTVAPVIKVELWKADAIRCTLQDANPDPATLKAVSRADGKDVPLEAVADQPGVFRVKPELRKFPVVVTARDLAGNTGTTEFLVGEQASAQPKDQPKVEPDAQPRLPEPPPPAKEATAAEVAVLTEKAFGKDSPEAKRTTRLLIPEIGLIAAEKASVGPGGRSVRFGTASIAVGNVPDAPDVFRGQEIVLTTDQPIKSTGDLRAARINQIEVFRKNVTVTLTPVRGPIANPASVPNSSIPLPPAPPVVPPSAPAPAIPPPPPTPAPVVPPQAVKDPGPLVERFAFVDSEPGVVNSTPMTIRFKFKIDPKAPLAELLPTPPKSSAKLPHWTNEDLAKAAELTFGESISKEVPKVQAMEAFAHSMAKINHFNLKKTDGFMLAMLEQRGDVRGLPVRMGDECRTREEQARVFAVMVDAIHSFKAQAKGKEPPELRGESQAQFWAQMTEVQAIIQSGAAKDAPIRLPRASQDQLYRATVAALMQILMPESEHFRHGLAKYLATVPHVEATKALAGLAIFSPEEEVRAAAIEGLKLRREKDYTDILLQGFRYPLPAVSKRAAEALVKLERKDVLANLIEVLESPDPRLPATEKRDGKEVTFVRELVKVNHHKNCLLCHAPGNTDNTPDAVLKVAVPLPGEPLAKPSDGGGYQSVPPPTPDIVVRLDMTYLRQDFSVMMPVNDAHPWPEMQRFDFLVRTRALTPAEAQAYEECCEADEPGRLSPYHRAALFALRELTGRDTEPTAAAWRKLLKLTK
jgi:hypothetical protein